MAIRFTLLCGLFFCLTPLWSSGRAQVQPLKAKEVTANLTFEQVPEEPSHLHVVLHVVNLSAQTLTWIMDPLDGIDAELIDSSGKPVAAEGGAMFEMMSGPKTFTLLPHDKLDIILSHTGGISVPGHSNGRYFLEIGSKLWFVPVSTAASYSLHVKLFEGAFDPEREGSPDSEDLPIIPRQKIVVIAGTK